jgi:hypothetical protein
MNMNRERDYNLWADNHEITITGRLLRIASVKHDWNEDIEAPEAIIKLLQSGNCRADIFTFIQRFPESKPKYNYCVEWDNVAAIPIKNYDHWLNNQINQESRNKIKKAEKKGVHVKVVNFDDDLMAGIHKIYNETPIRQGKPFSHYGKDVQTLKDIHATFLESSCFIGAYYKDELIGFIKLVHAGRFMRTMHILAMIKHRDKAPMNLLLAKSIEICCQKNIPYLVYAKFTYGKVGSDTLMYFKRDNGFESIIIPRYYIPLTNWGTVALKLKLHHGIVQVIPGKMIRELRDLRAKFYTKKYSQLSH